MRTSFNEVRMPKYFIKFTKNYSLQWIQKTGHLSALIKQSNRFYKTGSQQNTTKYL